MRKKLSKYFGSLLVTTSFVLSSAVGVIPGLSMTVYADDETDSMTAYDLEGTYLWESSIVYAFPWEEFSEPYENWSPRVHFTAVDDSTLEISGMFDDAHKITASVNNLESGSYLEIHDEQIAYTHNSFGDMQLWFYSKDAGEFYYNMILQISEDGTLKLSSKTILCFVISEGEYAYQFIDLCILPGSAMTPAIGVDITGGENATSNGGDISQTVIGETAIEDVVYTADDGYLFPADDEAYGVKNGISVILSEDQKSITVSGTPTSDTEIIIPDALATISVSVTFKVENGTWDDGTTEDKIVTLTGYEGDTLTLSADQIPAVGTKPADSYKEGAWDVTPSADIEITADTTYTYTYEEAPLTGWQKIDGEWYFYDMSGEMQKGWEQIDDEWYYLDPETGAMQKGWKEIDGKWYFLESSGKMFTGWRLGNGGNWYYLNTSGAMVTGWKEIDGEWYFFETSGEMFTGWKMGNGGNWYYLNTSGAMVTGWQKVDGEWYYFNTDGSMAAYEYCDGYWLNANGTWTYEYRASWKQDSTGSWYGDSNGWYAKNETLKIDGSEYTFNAEGYLAEA